MATSLGFLNVAHLLSNALQHGRPKAQAHSIVQARLQLLCAVLGAKLHLVACHRGALRQLYCGS